MYPYQQPQHPESIWNFKTLILGLAGVILFILIVSAFFQWIGVSGYKLAPVGVGIGMAFMVLALIVIGSQGILEDILSS